MRKIKYLFICSFVIMGLLAIMQLQNVAAYPANQEPTTNAISMSTVQSNCIGQQGYANNEASQTQCILGHTNCHEQHFNENKKDDHHGQSTHHENHHSHTQHH